MSAPERGACEAATCKAQCQGYAEVRKMHGNDGGWRMCSCGHTLQVHRKVAAQDEAHAVAPELGAALDMALAGASKPTRVRRKGAGQ